MKGRERGRAKKRKRGKERWVEYHSIALLTLNNIMSKVAPLRDSRTPATLCNVKDQLVLRERVE